MSEKYDSIQLTFPIMINDTHGTSWSTERGYDITDLGAKLEIVHRETGKGAIVPWVNVKFIPFRRDPKATRVRPATVKASDAA